MLRSMSALHLHPQPAATSTPTFACTFALTSTSTTAVLSTSAPPSVSAASTSSWALVPVYAHVHEPRYKPFSTSAQAAQAAHAFPSNKQRLLVAHCPQKLLDLDLDLNFAFSTSSSSLPRRLDGLRLRRAMFVGFGRPDSTMWPGLSRSRKCKSDAYCNQHRVCQSGISQVKTMERRG
jgi:hypothetical protein